MTGVVFVQLTRPFFPTSSPCHSECNEESFTISSRKIPHCVRNDKRIYSCYSFIRAIRDEMLLK